MGPSISIYRGLFKGLDLVVEQDHRTGNLFVRWAGAGFHLNDVTIPGLREAALKLLAPPPVSE